MSEKRVKQRKGGPLRKEQKAACGLFVFGFSLLDYFKVSNYAKIPYCSL